MISIEAETPQIRWKRQVNGEPSSPLIHDIDEEKVYFGVQSEGEFFDFLISGTCKFV